MADDDELALLQAWRDGDKQAGGKLLQRHFRSVYRFFATKLDRDSDIDDLIQRTFTGALESRDRFRGDASVKTWLLAIARNVLRQWAWERSRQRRREAAVDDEVSFADLGVGPSTAFAQRRETKLLATALQRLVIDDQIVLELYFWERLKAREIAEVFGVPEGTVRGRIRKAKQALEAELDKLARTREELSSAIDGLETWAAKVAEQLGG